MSRVIAAVLAAVIALGSLTAVSFLAPRHTLAAAGPYDFCPAAKSLVKHSTKFNGRTLAPGVHLAESTLGHKKHRLRLSVVRVNLKSPRTAIAPLHHAITSRHKLSKLARRPHLIAATNGTYFNFAFGAPTVPFLSPTGPVVLSRQHRRVAGISVAGRAQDGFAWLHGHVAAGHHRFPLAAINEVDPPGGLSIYTPEWGDSKVPLSLLEQSLAIRHGEAVGEVANRRTVPPHGYLLVGSTTAAINALGAFQRIGDVAVRYHAKTDAQHRFSQAYGVGTQTVASAHHVRSGLYCNAVEIYAARTDFAWRDHGRELILATIESPKGSESYGVDENQMSQIMVGLGAARSFALDGGGSTELVARLPRLHNLSIRTPGRQGHERPIPLGIGVYTLPAPPSEHKHKHKHKKPPPTHKQQCLLGILLCH